MRIDPKIGANSIYFTNLLSLCETFYSPFAMLNPLNNLEMVYSIDDIYNNPYFILSDNFDLMLKHHSNDLDVFMCGTNGIACCHCPFHYPDLLENEEYHENFYVQYGCNTIGCKNNQLVKFVNECDVMLRYVLTVSYNK